METNYKRKKKKSYRLFIRVVDEKQNEGGKFYDEFGREIVMTKWIQVMEANLGSLKFPNAKILEFRLDPPNIDFTYNSNTHDIF